MNELERVHFLLGKASVAALTEEETDFLKHVLIRVDSLQQQLAERDRTIALLTTERDICKSSFEHWNKEAHRVVDENSKLRKALETATDALNGIINGEWSETIDDQFLEVFTTRRINPSRIANEALFVIKRELEG